MRRTLFLVVALYYLKCPFFKTCKSCKEIICLIETKIKQSTETELGEGNTLDSLDKVFKSGI